MSNQQDTMARRDLKMAEDKIQRHLRGYRRARGVLQHLEASKEVMDIYISPFSPMISPSVVMWLKNKG